MKEREMNNKEKKVSVIITTYKRPFEILARAIESALIQTHKNYEVIVVDDSPSSPERNLIKEKIEEKYSGQVRYVQNEKNVGACASRNIGIGLSDGDFIAFLDDDDLWLPQKNELMLAGFTGKEIGLVYCDILSYRGTRRVKQKPFVHYEGKVFPELLSVNFIGGCSIPLIPREVFDVCGMFDERLPSSQDTDLWRRIALQYDVKYVDIPLVICFYSEVSITRSSTNQINGWLMMLQKYDDEYRKRPKVRERCLNRVIVAYISNKRTKEAITLFRKEYSYSFVKRLKHFPVLVKGALKLVYLIVKGNHKSRR